MGETEGMDGNSNNSGIEDSSDSEEGTKNNPTSPARIEATRSDALLGGID